MPERVKKLKGQVQVLHVGLEELTGALKKFLNVEGSGQPIPKGQRICKTMFPSLGSRP